jgi:hypothetical protein
MGCKHCPGTGLKLEPGSIPQKRVNNMSSIQKLVEFIQTNGGDPSDYQAKINSYYANYRWSVKLKVKFEPTGEVIELPVVTL